MSLGVILAIISTACLVGILTVSLIFLIRRKNMDKRLQHVLDQTNFDDLDSGELSPEMLKATITLIKAGGADALNLKDLAFQKAAMKFDPAPVKPDKSNDGNQASN